MKKIFIVFIILCFPLSVFADNMNMKIAEAENEIQKSTEKNIKCGSEITLDEELLDEAVYSASEKKKEYTDLESYKKLETNVLLNITTNESKTAINIPNSIKDYSSLADNVVMNINGMYCYINLNEIGSDFENVKLTINDSQNVIGNYNGTAPIDIIKTITIVLIGIVLIYVIGFIFFVAKKTDLNENFSKKKIYIFGITIFVISILYGGVLFFTDLSSFAEKKLISISDNDNPVFEVNFDGSENINGIYMGLPVYGEGFTPEYTAVWLKAEDSSQNDKIIGGNYNEVFEIMKFPIRKNGNYYLKNNKREFEDISENNKDLYKAVSVLASKNILNGKTEGMYGVDDTVTRGEAITMFSKLLNLENTNGGDVDFDDVSNSDWYYDYVSEGKKNNILKGYDDNTFRANNTMTRQEFAGVLGQIMENRLGYAVSEDYSNLSVYEDNGEIALWAKKYVSLLEKENMNICDKLYEPKKPITRGEAAILLYRGYKLIK